ncbi:MAG: membrane protein insertion efficiency factor YidD [Candidatus Eisenbacteria sp.]|nr:membrane protein insertion efficiency factor YidD [Candidatus Eisenbacteria bacterium]
MVVRILTALIGIYQRLISPLSPPSCRFVPTCSSYAQQALGKHGLVRGGVLAMRRILRCHPWNPGGIDPLP